MPSHSKSDVIQRQWELLQLIPAHDHPGRSAQELSSSLDTRGYPVTLRTVERDLLNLRQCLPLDRTKGRPQRWRWRKTRAVDIPGMEAAEAMALYMTKDVLGSHLPSCFLEALHTRFSQADRTLRALARSGSRARWSDKVRVVPAHVVLLPPRIAPKIVQTLQRALLNDIPLEAEYQSHQDPAPRRRLLYPRALILRGSSLYLVAHQKGGGEAPHHYAVQRFGQLKLRELEPWVAQPFSLDAFLADGANQFGDGRLIRLKARVSTELSRTLRDSPLSADMCIDAALDGTLTLTATVRDTWSLHTWVLGHAEHLRIDQPAFLRTLIAKRIKQAAAQYD